VRLKTATGESLPIKAWLRAEWQRTGLPFKLTNEAAGVGNAASRKYFTADDLWYLPPPEMLERIAQYANQHGRPTTQPYFSLDGQSLVTAAQWSGLRAKWHHQHGVTNVWTTPPTSGVERIKAETGKALHPNQKPLALMDLIIQASSDIGDVIWEPFGGLCSGVLAATRLGRIGYAAEINSEFYQAAGKRLGLTE
jgi:site-specific DNA-methyltransferase (adenine-specific)